MCGRPSSLCLHLSRRRAVNISILEELLSTEGYECLTACSGVEALEIYLTCDPPVKLVLLDVTLPDMSGHEVRHAQQQGLVSNSRDSSHTRHDHSVCFAGLGVTLHSLTWAVTG